MPTAQPRRPQAPSYNRVRRFLAQLPDDYLFRPDLDDVSKVCPITQTVRQMHPDKEVFVGLAQTEAAGQQRGYQVVFRLSNETLNCPLSSDLNNLARKFDELATDQNGVWHAVTAAEVRAALHIRGAKR